MSPRRRLRTRYERVESPAPPPAVLTPAAEVGSGEARDAAAVPGTGDSLLAGPPSIPLAPLVASPPGPAPAVEAGETLAPAPAAEVEETVAPKPAVEAGETVAPLPGVGMGWRGARVRAVVTMVALAVVAFATGLVLFNDLVMPRLIHGVGQVTVPDLTNLTVEQAEETLRPLGL